MSVEIISTKRDFQVWEYSVGHLRLLLRSAKDQNSPTRIDVCFKNVSAMSLPTTLVGLTISEIDLDEIVNLHLQLSPEKLRGRKVFTIREAFFTGYVVAGAAACHEDKGEYDEPSHFSHG